MSGGFSAPALDAETTGRLYLAMAALYKELDEAASDAWDTMAKDKDWEFAYKHSQAFDLANARAGAAWKALAILKEHLFGDARIHV